MSTDERVGNRNKYTMRVFVNLQNPLLVKMENFRQIKKEIVTGALGIPSASSAEDITSSLIGRGYDGVILDYSPTGYSSQEIMVIDPENISYVDRKEKDK